MYVKSCFLRLIEWCKSCGVLRYCKLRTVTFKRNSCKSCGLNIFKFIYNACVSFVIYVYKFISNDTATKAILLLIILDSILIIGLLTNSCLEHFLISNIGFVEKLQEIYIDNNNFNFVNIVASLGALISLLLFHLRNKAMTEQTNSQYKIFNEDKQFSNFLEATKLLTNKDSTSKAKIAAMFSLADVAKAHPKHVDRIINVLNGELTPLIKVLEGEYDSKIYTHKLKEKHIARRIGGRNKETQILNYTKCNLVSLESLKHCRETIKNWMYNGNDTEKVVCATLYVIRKILLEVEKTEFDFSNTIFFDIDESISEKDVKDRFRRKNSRIEHAMFLECDFTNFNFKENNFHFCMFINCDLKDASFDNANLWGTTFTNCSLDGTSFEEAECEGVKLQSCENLRKTQLNSMHFVNLEKLKEPLKYPLIIDQKTIDNSEDHLSLNNFITSEYYEKWKNNDKN